jgi:formate dehydrogenase major subunit
VELEQGRALFERVWGAPLPRGRGLDLMQMIDAAEVGQLKALYAIGYDVLLTNPNADVTRRALSQLELLVVQDMFMTETGRELAHVFLPVASSFEKDGTFMNAERRVQRVRRVLDPPGEARSDADILCAVAAAMGHGERFAFRSAEEVWNEIRAVWPKGAGISYERLERGGLQWPCPSEDHPGTRVLHADAFANGRRAALQRIEYRPSGEVCDDEYPLLLVTGRRLYQFNAATMTGRTPNALLQPADVLDVCERDARQYALQDGDRVRLRSRHGEARVPVHIDNRVQPGCVFATFHTADVFLNRLIGPQRDAVTHTPEYKVTAVQLERS